MKPAEKAATRWGNERLERMLNEYQRICKPYEARIESTDGLLALTIVSGIGICVYKGIEGHRALDEAIDMAAQISGLPVEVFEAFARWQLCMLSTQKT